MPTVALVDSYSVLASTERSLFISCLREFASVRSNEYTDDELGKWADRALTRLGPCYSFATLKDPEYHAAILLAAITIAEARMQASQRYFSVSSRVGSTNAGERVRNNQDVVNTLRDEFQKYIEDTGIVCGGAETIVVGTFTKYDPRTDFTLPYSLQRGPKQPQLVVSRTGADFVDLIWSEDSDDDFMAYTIYRSLTPGIADPTRVAASVNPGVIETAEEIEIIHNRGDTGRRIGELDPTTHFFVVVVTDGNGRLTVSNEVQADLGA